MNRWRVALVLASASLLTGGCVAAAIPVVAGGMIARGELREGASERTEREQGAAERPRASIATSPGSARITALSELPPPSGTRPSGAAPRTDGTVVITDLTELPPPSAAADGGSSTDVYRALRAYISGQAAKRRRREPLRSVVLDAGATLDVPRYVPCDAKPLAMLVDFDEDPARSADPDARWRRWQGDGSDAISVYPGALDAIAAARREGVAVIFTSARSPDGGAGVVAALEQLGLGRLEPGKTLYLRGQAAADDVRRAVAASHCVIALIGDEPGDFSQLLPAMDDRAMRWFMAADARVAPLMGTGWFQLPNPVRGTATPSINSAGGD